MLDSRASWDIHSSRRGNIRRPTSAIQKEVPILQFRKKLGSSEAQWPCCSAHKCWYSVMQSSSPEYVSADKLLHPVCGERLTYAGKSNRARSRQQTDSCVKKGIARKGLVYCQANIWSAKIKFSTISNLSVHFSKFNSSLIAANWDYELKHFLKKARQQSNQQGFFFLDGQDD